MPAAGICSPARLVSPEALPSLPYPTNSTPNHSPALERLRDAEEAHLVSSTRNPWGDTLHSNLLLSPIDVNSSEDVSAVGFQQDKRLPSWSDYSGEGFTRASRPKLRAPTPTESTHSKPPGGREVSPSLDAVTAVLDIESRRLLPPPESVVLDDRSPSPSSPLIIVPHITARSQPVRGQLLSPTFGTQSAPSSVRNDDHQNRSPPPPYLARPAIVSPSSHIPRAGNFEAISVEYALPSRHSIHPSGNPAAFAGSPPAGCNDNISAPVRVAGMAAPDGGVVLVRCAPYVLHQGEPSGASINSANDWYEGGYEPRKVFVCDVPTHGLLLCQSPASVVQCLEDIPLFVFKVSGLELSSSSQILASNDEVTSASRSERHEAKGDQRGWCRLVLTFRCSPLPPSGDDTADMSTSFGSNLPDPDQQEATWELLFNSPTQRSRWAWWLYTLCTNSHGVERFEISSSPPSWWGTVSDEDVQPTTHPYFDELAACSSPAFLTHRIVPSYRLPIVFLNESRHRTLASQPKTPEPAPHTLYIVESGEQASRGRLLTAAADSLLEGIVEWMMSALLEEAEDGPCANLVNAISTQAYSILDERCKSFADEDRRQPLRKGLLMRYTTCFCHRSTAHGEMSRTQSDLSQVDVRDSKQVERIASQGPQRRPRAVSFRNDLPPPGGSYPLLPAARTKSNLQGIARSRALSVTSVGGLSTTTAYSHDRDISASDNVMILENAEEESLALRAHVCVSLWCELAADTEYSFWDAQSAKELGKVATSTLHDVRSALLKRRTTVSAELELLLTPMFSLYNERGAFGQNWVDAESDLQQRDLRGEADFDEGDWAPHPDAFGATMDGPGATAALQELQAASRSSRTPLPNGGLLSLYKPRRGLLDEIAGNLKSLQKSARSRLASMRATNPLQEALRRVHEKEADKKGEDLESSPPTSPHLGHAIPPSDPLPTLYDQPPPTPNSRQKIHDELEASNLIRQLDLQYLITITREAIPRHEPVEFTDKSVRDAAQKQFEEEMGLPQSEINANPISAQKMKIYRVYGQIGLRLTFADASDPKLVDQLLYRVPRLIVCIRFITAAECERFYHRIQLLSSRCMVAQLRDERHRMLPYWFDEKDVDMLITDEESGLLAQEVEDEAKAKRIEYNRPQVSAFVHDFIALAKKPPLETLETTIEAKDEGSPTIVIDSEAVAEERAMERVMEEYYAVLEGLVVDGDGGLSFAEVDAVGEEAEKIVQRWLTQSTPPAPLTEVSKTTKPQPQQLVRLAEVMGPATAHILTPATVTDADAVEDGTVLVTKSAEVPQPTSPLTPLSPALSIVGVERTLRCVNLNNRVQVDAGTISARGKGLSAKVSHSVTRVIIAEDAKSRLFKADPVVIPIDCVTLHVEDKEFGNAFELVVNEEKALHRLARISQNNPDFSAAIKWMRTMKERVHHRRMSSHNKSPLGPWRYARLRLDVSSYSVRNQWINWFERAQGPLSETFRRRVKQRKLDEQIHRLEKCVEGLDGLTAEVVDKYAIRADVTGSETVQAPGVHPSFSAGALAGLRRAAPSWLLSETRSHVAHATVILNSTLALVQTIVPSDEAPRSPHLGPSDSLGAHTESVLLDTSTSSSTIYSSSPSLRPSPSASGGRFVDPLNTTSRSFLFHEYTSRAATEAKILPSAAPDEASADTPPLWCALSGFGGEPSFGMVYLVSNLLSDGTSSPALPSFGVGSAGAPIGRWRRHFHSLCLAEFCAAFGVREGVDTVIDVSSVVRADTGVADAHVVRLVLSCPSAPSDIQVPHPPWLVAITFLDASSRENFLKSLADKNPTVVHQSATRIV